MFPFLLCSLCLKFNHYLPLPVEYLDRNTYGIDYLFSIKPTTNFEIFPWKIAFDDLIASRKVTVNYSEPIERYFEHFNKNTPLDNNSIKVKGQTLFPVSEKSLNIGNINYITEGRISSKVSNMIEKEMHECFYSTIPFFVCYIGFLVIIVYVLFTIRWKPSEKRKPGNTVNFFSYLTFFFIYYICLLMFILATYLFFKIFKNTLANRKPKKNPDIDFINKNFAINIKESFNQLNKSMHEIGSLKEKYDNFDVIDAKLTPALSNFEKNYVNTANEKIIEIKKEISDFNKACNEKGLVTGLFPDISTLSGDINGFNSKINENKSKWKNLYENDKKGLQKFLNHVEAFKDIENDLKRYQPSLTSEGFTNITELFDFKVITLVYEHFRDISVLTFTFTVYLFALFSFCFMRYDSRFKWRHFQYYAIFASAVLITICFILALISNAVYILHKDFFKVMDYEIFRSVDALLFDAGLKGGKIPSIDFNEISNGAIDYKSPVIDIPVHNMGVYFNIYKKMNSRDYKLTNIYEHTGFLMLMNKVIFSSAMDNVNEETALHNLIGNLKEIGDTQSIGYPEVEQNVKDFFNKKNLENEGREFAEKANIINIKLNEIKPAPVFLEMSGDLTTSMCQKYKEVLYEIVEQFALVKKSVDSIFVQKHGMNVIDAIMEIFVTARNKFLYQTLRDSKFFLFIAFTGINTVMFGYLYIFELLYFDLFPPNKMNTFKLFVDNGERSFSGIQFDPYSADINREYIFKPNDNDFFGITPENNELNEYYVI